MLRLPVKGEARFRIPYAWLSLKFDDDAAWITAPSLAAATEIKIGNKGEINFQQT